MLGDRWASSRPRRFAPRFERPGEAVACGALVTAAHLLAGVSGPLLDVFFVRAELDRFEVIATKAVTQTAGHALKIVYFAVLVPNTPVRVLAVLALFLAVLVASVVCMPALPWWAFWVYFVPIPLFYKLQAWSHKVWNIENDITEFNRKYTKGFVLFVVLLAIGTLLRSLRLRVTTLLVLLWVAAYVGLPYVSFVGPVYGPVLFVAVVALLDLLAMGLMLRGFDRLE